MPKLTTSSSSLLHRLFVMFLSGVVVVALSAAPAEAKKKKKKKKHDDESSASAESGSKKKKKKKKSKDEETASSEESKSRKVYDEDEEAAPAPKAAAKAEPAPKAAPAAPAAPETATAAPAEEPMPLPPMDEPDTTVISRTAGLGRLKLQHVNEVTGFRLTALSYELNNHPIYTFPEAGKPETDFGSKAVQIWEGVLPTGDNEIKVTALYKGVGSFFSYLNDMTFKKSDTTRVKVSEGATTTVTVLGQEDTNPFIQTEDRPKFDYRTETSSKTATAR